MLVEKSVEMSKQGVGPFTKTSCIASRPRSFFAARLMVAATAAVFGLAGDVQTAAAGSPVGIYFPPNGASAVAAAQAAAAASAASAAAAAAKQMQAFTAASQALQGAQQSQNIARGTFLLNMPSNLGSDPRNPGKQLPNVPDGIGPGGLDPSPSTNDPTLWQGASLPQQFNDGGKVTVNIGQTQPKAILNWQTFNVGSNTTLNFIQGGSDWTALNRVAPGGSSPSQILGRINAPGSVYVINQNGIIFGGGSQINVHTLIASSLDVGHYDATRAQRDAFFLNTGIAVPTIDTSHNNILFPSFSTTLGKTSGQIDGDVTVKPGARITAAPAGALSDEPGFVYLFGSNVANYGSISAPLGEVALVAGQAIAIVPKVYDPLQNGQVANPGTPTDLSVSIRGAGFSILNRLSNNYPLGTGQVTNAGIISTPGGSTILNGDQVAMSGVISADSGISRNSQVFLDAQTSVNLSGTISVQPLEGDAPLPSSNSQGSSSVAAFVPPSIGMSAYQVNLAPSSLISAPGASVAVSATASNFLTGINHSLLSSNSDSEQILMQSGATIDVSGLRNVQLPATYNIVSLQLRGLEFADSPLQRNGPLFGQTVYVDLRNTGVRSDGSTWVGTPLADVSGYVALVTRSIDQLLTTGGSVSFKTELNNNAGLNAGAGLVTLQHGSSINVAGGSVSYQPGYVPTTTLIGSDGRLYDISKADPNLTYVGIFGQFVVNHPHWNVTETFLDAFQKVFQPGYTEGHDAGGVVIQAVTPQIDADLQFGALIGKRQAALGLSRSATVNGVSAQGSPDQLPSQGYLSLMTPQSIVVTDGGADYSNAKFKPQNTTPVALSAEQYSGYGVSSLSLTATDLYVPASASLNLAAGGSFSATTSFAMDIEGGIVVRGGRINLTTNPYALSKIDGARFQPATGSGRSEIFIGGNLDTRGLWVNDIGLPGDLLAGPGFIKGGSITLQTFVTDDFKGTAGSIILANGSVLDASSGGYINEQGVAKLQSPGGNITLAASQGQYSPEGVAGPAPPIVTRPHSVVALGGTLRSYGFTSGGTLTISSPGIQIGGTPSANADVLNIPTALFTQGGFSSYVLQSPVATGPVARSIVLSANENLVLQQTNFSSLVDYRSVATGSDIAQFAPVVTLASDLRKPVNLTLQSLNILLDTGSAVAADPQASIKLVADDASGSVRILGSIVDHGGAVTVQAASVRLGAGATIDLSGQLISNSTFGQVSGASQSGTLLQGGSVAFDTSIAGPDSNGVLGSVIAEQGASIDVSGATADITGRVGVKYAPSGRTVTSLVPSWSDAGTVSINTGTFLWDGTFKAEAGAPQGNRGTLILGGNAVVLQQTNSSGLDVAKLISQGFVPTPEIIATADRLAAFDTVYLYSGVYNRDPSSGALNRGLGFFSAATPYPAGVSLAPLTPIRAPLQIYGDLNLSINNRLYLEAASIASDGKQSADIRLSANYVMLAGSPVSLKSFAPTSGAGNLVISANAIDVQSAGFSSFLKVSLTSAGDIRLMSPPVNNGDAATNSTTFFGQIVAGGYLSFTAQRIYPVSAVDFEIVSTLVTAPDKNGNVAPIISFDRQPGADTSIPMSAGGSLTVSAQAIIQNGNLFAPLGKITLGALTVADLSPNDTRGTLVPTYASTLGAGSLTSTSLLGLTVPYGQTEDGTNWFYNSAQAPLSGPPTKSIRVIGSSVVDAGGSTLDLTGGGDLLAFEFVQGKGGSRDVLSNLVSTGSQTRPTYAQPTIYAILPSGKQPGVGAFDIHFNSYLGDPSPLAGQQVYLNGTSDFAAGWYTLYPAHYATLPGAFRVVDYGTALAKPSFPGTKLPDGTQIVGGYFGQSPLGKRASGTELFSVQSSSVWRQYSEIRPSQANAYFGPSAGHVSGTPVLPIDGGRLVVNALAVLDLSGTFKSQAAAGGRGGDLDLTAPNIDIVESGGSALPGYLAVNVNQLNNAGFASLLIGGLRTDKPDGTWITPTAANVRVDLTNTALSAPEIILVATPNPTFTTTLIPIAANGAPSGLNLVVLAPDASAGGTVTIASGSVVTSLGDTGGMGRNYLLVGDPNKTSTFAASALATYLGGTLDTTASATTITNVPTANAFNGVIKNYALANLNSAAGALLLVSNAPQVSVTRRNVPADIGPVNVKFAGGVFSVTLPDPAPALGVVKVEAGARVGSQPGSAASRKQSVVISATALSNAIQIDPRAIVGGNSLTLAARNIAVGDAANLAAGFVITRAILPQLTAVNSLELQAFAGNIKFDSFSDPVNCATTCPINFGDGTPLQNLTLDTPSIVGNGTEVIIVAANKLTLLNSGAGAPPTAPVQAANLVLAASEIDLGGGNVGIAGFNAVDLVATRQLFVKGGGALTFGAVATDPTPVYVAITTPNLLVGSGTATQFTLTTLGSLLLHGTGSAPPASTELGGNIAINAASIELQQATIQAVSGTVALHATGAGAGGYILLGDSSLISAPGYAQLLIDQTRYSPGGKVVLTSDHGGILTSASSKIDLSQPAGGLGSGGELDITALEGNIVSRSGVGILDAVILANGAPGRGGIFHLNIKGGLANNSLDSLAAQLSTGGFFEEVDIHTRTGGIVLNTGTLTAHTIILTADETDDNLGRIRISDGATLNASGGGSTAASMAGGTIELYGRSVDLSGSLIARAVNGSGQAGGKVTVGTSGTASGTYDATYGYEVLSSAGLLNLDQNFKLDLSGGARDGSLDGSVTFRAPLIAGGLINSRIALSDPQHQIVGVKDIILEAYAIWSTADSTTGNKHFDGIIDPAGTAASPQPGQAPDHKGFYQNTLVGFVQNALTPLASNFGGLVNLLPPGTTLHIRPGIELRNPLTTVNNGDITVASAWNLAAGTMSNLKSETLTYQTVTCFFNFCFPVIKTSTVNYFDPTSSAIQFAYRFGVEPGSLTLRAARNVNVNASISDGFFSYQNFNDQTYDLVATTTPPWQAVPPAPVPSDPFANSISPTADPTTGGLASYDLFPDTLNVVTTNGTKTVHPDSWSYRLTAGADFASTNPNAVGSLANYAGAANGGDVVIAGHTTYNTPTTAQPAGSIALPTMLRTGVGNITINAARDLALADHAAPGVIYSAGRNSPLLSSPGFANTGTSSAPFLTVANPDGFIEPNVIAYLDGKSTGAIQELGKTTGPVTAAAFPTAGGDIVIKVQRDIKGWQNVTSGGTPLYQFYAPWIFSQSSGSSGAGAFAPIQGIGQTFQFQPQSAWWIEFGRFDQGVLSAGGNVTVIAGRDVSDFSISLPTTGRVSGGLTALNTPVTHLYGSGNMNVRVGGNLYSGSFYEGSGSANITVAGSVASNWTGQVRGSNTPVQVSTVLAVDTGQIDLTAAGSIAITNIINPVELHKYIYNAALGAFGSVGNPATMATYGPNSAVRLTSIGGDVVIDAVPLLLSNAVSGSSPGDYIQTYPATVDVSALRGNITTPLTGMILTDSQSATLNLLAQGSVDLRGGVSPTSPLSPSLGSSIAAGTALIDLAFNPFEPNMGTLPFTTPALAHANDPAGDLYDHIYAVSGDITGTIAGNSGYGVIAIPRPVLVKAGRDIIDLNLTAQNIRTSDVSQIIAGRDITYDGLSVGGGLQIAGPGFLDVEAGRNIGPFLPASADLSTGTNAVVTQQGIVSNGNAAGFSAYISLAQVNTGVRLNPASPSGAQVSYPVGNNFYPVGLPNPLFLGANGNGGQRNFLLPATGASIVAMFGVGPGINYQGVVTRYIDPATAIAGRPYLTDLLTFLNAHGINASSPSDAWSKWSGLPQLLQHMFVDQVFYSELNFDNAASRIQDGYAMVNTMFPASLGYTQNNAALGLLGAPKDQLVKTGDLNLLHATIQTGRGGDLLLFGPGGQILVGSLGTEPNSNLKLNNLGILTLSGGDLYTFTDESVLVNSSRIFTEQGGNIFMWSSNGDLDGGRGAKTTASLNALAVNIDNNDYQTVDRGGLVTGAGIGTLASTKGSRKAKVTLLAPTGTIDAGDAGIRASGDIILFAAQILNASNISVGGTTTTNQTVTVPSTTSLVAANSASAAARPAGPDVTGSTPTSQPSVVIVEMLGYGGGDGSEPAPADDQKNQDNPGP